MRIFITGLGSDLGTRIAQQLESENEVDSIAGVDMYPPRRYLLRTKFIRAHFDDQRRISETIATFNPDVIINFGVYEPGARLNKTKAQLASIACANGIANAIERIDRDVKIISRSSIVAYGFSNPRNIYDETSPLNPDTPYGYICRDVEKILTKASPTTTVIRTAPEIDAHVPHPIARLLLLPALPIELRLPFSTDIGFPVISPRDVVELFIKQALSSSTKGAVLHGVCSSNATMTQAARIGKRIPIFVSGIGYEVVKRLSYLAGAPIDEHIEMLIRRGMTIDSTSTRMRHNITSQDSPTEVLTNLYEGDRRSTVTFKPSEVLS